MNVFHIIDAQTNFMKGDAAAVRHVHDSDHGPDHSE